MQGIVLAGVELISAIFHYQYSGKKKKKNIKPMAIKLKKTQTKEEFQKRDTLIYIIYILLWIFFSFFFLVPILVNLVDKTLQKVIWDGDQPI